LLGTKIPCSTSANQPGEEIESEQSKSLEVGNMVRQFGINTEQPVPSSQQVTNVIHPVIQWHTI
jgi:hypothetical protein